MPVPVMNYAALPPFGDYKSAGMMDSIARGFQLGLSPFMAHEEMQQRKLANQLSKIALEYAPKMNEAELKRSQALANLPFGGATLPGEAGQVLGLESLRQMFGENSPQYQQAMDAFNLGLQSDLSRINYQNTLAQTAPTRMLTPLGKAITEQQNISQGFMPNGKPLSYPGPNGTKELSGVYDLLINKTATDTDARKRNLFAENIEKTLQSINPEDLFQYGGLKGTAEKYTQQGLASLGKQSADYDKYQQAMQGAEMLATQVRQFYGDSIQPQMMKRLEAITNPASWTNNPKLSLEMFNKTKSILQKEMQTYRDAMKNSDVYRGLQNSDLTINPSPKQAQALVDAGIATYAPNGNTKSNEDPLGIR